MKRTATLLAVALFAAFGLQAQTISVRDNNSSVDKWSPDSRLGVYVGTVTSNSPATVTDAEKGIFSAKTGGLRSGKDYTMYIYSPYQTSPTFKDGKMRVCVPTLQDGCCAPVSFGKADIKGARRVETECDLAARTTSIIIKLSSHNAEYSDWNLEKITLVAEEGVISGDALMDTDSGKLTPDPDGTCSNSVSFVPASEMKVGSGYYNIKLKLIPCNGLHGTRFRLDYTFSKEGRRTVICHDVVGMTLYESYTYTLEERIPAVIAGRWHMSDYPGESWDFVSPESMGYSSAKLEQLRKTIEKDYTTTSMMVIVGGKVIFSMGDLEEPVRIASCRKSLMSMLYGKYVENGTIDL